MTGMRFHAEDRLRIPEPDFVMFGAKLKTGKVRVWVSTEPGLITLVRQGGLDIVATPSGQAAGQQSAEVDGRIDDVHSFDGATYAEALAKALSYFGGQRGIPIRLGLEP